MSFLQRMEYEISSWPGVTVHAHRYGGREFRFGRAEVGHIHVDGTVDIPFPRPVRDALLSEGLAEEHRWVPNSGWATFFTRSEADYKHALWLMRLSYLRYALRENPDPHQVLDQESLSLDLSPTMKALFERCLPTPASVR